MLRKLAIVFVAFMAAVVLAFVLLRFGFKASPHEVLNALVSVVAPLATDFAQSGDEINILRGGANYGWPEISHSEEYGGGPMGEGSERVGPSRRKPANVPRGLRQGEAVK